MIGRIRGDVLERGAGMVVVEAAGVGYEILVPESVLVQMPEEGERVDLRVRQVFREDGVTLYGFLEPFQRRLFDLLVSVKGCGPKIGLSLIGQLGEDAVAGAILAQDARALARASGVGARLAERIILELKEKMAEETLTRKLDTHAQRRPAQQAAPEDEVIAALVQLGFRRPEAESAARDAREEASSVEEQVKLAVRALTAGARA